MWFASLALHLYILCGLRTACISIYIDFFDERIVFSCLTALLVKHRRIFVAVETNLDFIEALY